MTNKDFKQYSELFLDGMPEPHIYDTKIDDAAKTASLQADDCLKMIGKAPVTCTSIEEQQNYYRINMQNVAKIKALESKLVAKEKEILKMSAEINEYGNKLFYLKAEREMMIKSNNQRIKELANYHVNCTCKHFDKTHN